MLKRLWQRYLVRREAKALLKILQHVKEEERKLAETNQDRRPNAVPFKPYGKQVNGGVR